MSFAEEKNHSSAKASSHELKEIKAIRDHWLSSLVRESQQVHEIYLDDLKKLKNRLDKQEKWDDSKEVAKELKDSDSVKPSQIKSAFSKKPNKAVPRLRFAQTIYQRKFRELLKRKRTGYLIALENLESELNAKKRVRDAARVGKEIELVKKGFSVFELSTDGKPTSAEELKNWLPASHWEIIPSGKNKSYTKIQLLGNGEMKMPWIKANAQEKARWEARGPRTFRMIHPERKWVFEMEISQNMDTLTGRKVFKGGAGPLSKQIFWRGRRLK